MELRTPFAALAGLREAIPRDGRRGETTTAIAARLEAAIPRLEIFVGRLDTLPPKAQAAFVKELTLQVASRPSGMDEAYLRDLHNVLRSALVICASLIPFTADQADTTRAIGRGVVRESSASNSATEHLRFGVAVVREPYEHPDAHAPSHTHTPTHPHTHTSQHPNTPTPQHPHTHTPTHPHTLARLGSTGWAGSRARAAARRARPCV